MPPLSSFTKSCIALAVGNALVAAPATAATINVDEGCSLIEAIRSANNNSSGGSACEDGEPTGSDLILLTESPAAYTEASETDGEPSAMPVIRSDITIQGPSQSRAKIERDTIGAIEDFRIFTVESGARLQLNSVEVNGGVASQGAGIYAYESELVLDNTVISGNTATNQGGGIYAYSQSSVTVRNGSTVTLNNASIGGGVHVYFYSELTLENSTFSQNTAQSFGAISIQGSDAAVSLINVTIENNTATVGGGGGLGIVGEDLGAGNLTSLVIQGSTFTGNHASDDNGGAAYVQYMATEIINTTFSNNFANVGGGALYLKGSDSSLTLMSSTFNSNSTDLHSGSGGAICLGGTVANIIDTNFDANSAYYGGGVFSTDGSVVSFDGGIIQNNTANNAGGGIRHESNGLLTLTNITVESNDSLSTNGGGINAIAGSLVVNNSTISNNMANGSGGGIYHSGANLSLYVSTISGNSANVEGAGLFLIGTSNGIVNSTIYANATTSSLYANTIPFIINTVIASDVNAAIDDDDCVLSSGSLSAANNWFSDASCSGVANGIPLLGPLFDNNNGLQGTTLTHATLEFSPLLGIGLDSFCNTSVNSIFAFDQRRVRRTNCDVGAFEVAAEETCFVVKADNGRVITFCL